MDKKKLEDLTDEEIERLRAQFLESMQDAKAKAEAAKAGGPKERMEAGMAFIEAMTDAFDKLGIEDGSEALAGPEPMPKPEAGKVVLDLPDETTLRHGPVEILVERYAAIAAAAHQASENGQITRHNRFSDRVRKIAKALEARTPDARRALLPLLSHPDAGVRDRAAYDCRHLTSPSAENLSSKAK
jgi:hypothetical protein